MISGISALVSADMSWMYVCNSNPEVNLSAYKGNNGSSICGNSKLSNMFTYFRVGNQCVYITAA